MTGETPSEHQPTSAEEVDGIFERLAAGRLEEPRGEASGWTMTLPDGTSVTRSTLEGQARPLITLGADAVPALLRWAQDDRPALRYVATYALGQITGERPFVRHFAQDPHDAEHERAVRVWREWCNARQGDR